MFILRMHPCFYEETSPRQLSGHLKAFFFLGFWQFIDQYVVQPNFLIWMVTPYFFGNFQFIMT